MELENILNNDNIDERVAFLLSLLQVSNSDIHKTSDFESKIDLKNIDEKIAKGHKYYLDPICIEVAEELQKKNIFVIATVEYNDFIYLLLDKLDLDNMKILKAKFKENSTNYFINYEKSNYSGIRVKKSSDQTNRNISNEFLLYASDFKLQDIQRGYLNEKNFLMDICNCEKVEGLKEIKPDDAKIVFDINKMDKSFRDYLNDSGYEQYYLPEEHRIYLNEFYFNAHQNYLDNLKD